MRYPWRRPRSSAEAGKPLLQEGRAATGREPTYRPASHAQPSSAPHFVRRRQTFIPQGRRWRAVGSSSRGRVTLLAGVAPRSPDHPGWALQRPSDATGSALPESCGVARSARLVGPLETEAGSAGEQPARDTGATVMENRQRGPASAAGPLPRCPRATNGSGLPAAHGLRPSLSPARVMPEKTLGEAPAGCRGQSPPATLCVAMG